MIGSPKMQTDQTRSPPHWVVVALVLGVVMALGLGLAGLVVTRPLSGQPSPSPTLL